MDNAKRKLIQRTMDVQRELTKSGLSRRNLLKLGVLSAGTGMLLPIEGLSLRVARADLTCPIPGVEMISPRTTPFKDAFNRLEEMNPIYSTKSSVNELTDAMFLRGGKPTSAPSNALDSKLKLLKDFPEMASATPYPNLRHQAWDGTDKDEGLLAPPKDFYEMRAIQHQHVWHTDMPAGLKGQTAWGFVDRDFDVKASTTGLAGTNRCTGVPGPVFRLKYGRSAMIRIYNELPDAAVNTVSQLGFGTSTIATHMHNFHTPSESDGGPLYYNSPGKFWDHHYPAMYAGIKEGYVSPKNGVRGDYREALGSLWFHDHKHDFTSQNVYAGLFGAAPIYDEVDTGDETVAGTTGIRFPSHSQDAGSFPYEFDVPMMFHDRQFDPQGVDFFPLVCQDGAIGDKLTVNGTIQPFMKVQPRRYRIRMYNGGPSRFYWWWLRQGTGANFVPITVIGNDGNLMPRAVTSTSFKQGVAQRFDVILDFTGMKPGTEFYFVNRAEQTNGRGPSGKLLDPALSQAAIKFVVEAKRTGLTDNSTPIVGGMALRPLPALPNLPVLKKKEWVWGRGNGAWVSNGAAFDRYAAPYEVKEGSAEIWTHKNGGGSWSHPLHVHYEEGRILSYNGAATPDVNAPLETGRFDVYRIDPSATITTAMRFRDYKGIYPMHCHNVVHEDHGMMAMWKIV